MPSPRYAFNLTDEGVLRVVRTDGSPISLEERDWFKIWTSNRLKTEALEKTLTHQRSVEIEQSGIPQQGETRGGVRFELDPAVRRLEFIREARGLTKAAVARAWRGHPHQITDWARGQSRPHMESLRAWASALGRSLMLVPVPLVLQVQQMVAEWEDRHEPKLAPKSIEYHAQRIANDAMKPKGEDAA